MPWIFLIKGGNVKFATYDYMKGMVVRRYLLLCIAIISCMTSGLAQSDPSFPIPSKAPLGKEPDQLFLKTNVLPWLVAIPNISAEYSFRKHWSVDVDLLYCPWKISQKFSVKTAAILPEGRYWLKTNRKGSFFNLHFNLAWYNVRFGTFRYQDDGRLLLGGGIGYGFRHSFSDRWGIEFEIGAGVASTRYDRYFNVANGALKDTRSTFYFGIDRLGVSIVYHLYDL